MSELTQVAFATIMLLGFIFSGLGIMAITELLIHYLKKKQRRKKKHEIT